MGVLDKINKQNILPKLMLSITEKRIFNNKGDKMKIIESEDVRNIYISLNYYCNNECLMCGVPFNKHNKYNEGMEFYVNEINKIPFKIEPNDIITLSGGEPFMFLEIWNLIEYIRENFKCRIMIFTNGRALKNKEVVDKLVYYEIDKLVIPFFSYKQSVYNNIAGSSNAYQEVCQALHNLNKTDLYHEVKFLPMRQNATDIEETYIFIKNEFPKTIFTLCGVQYFGQAVTNVELIGIQYSRLKEELEKTFDTAIEKYNEIIPLYRFPMCVLDPIYWRNGVVTLFQEYIIGPDYSDVKLSDDNKQKFEIPETCVNCIGTCDWYSNKYEKLWGIKELKTMRCGNE